MIQVRTANSEVKITFSDRDGTLYMDGRNKTRISGVLTRQVAVQLGQALLEWGKEYEMETEAKNETSAP